MAAAAQDQGAAHGFVVGAVTTRLTVTVPPGIVGGDLVRVAAPDGSYHSIMVPAGLTEGQQFSVELLAGSSAVDLAKLKVLPASQDATSPSSYRTRFPCIYQPKPHPHFCS